MMRVQSNIVNIGFTIMNADREDSKGRKMKAQGVEINQAVVNGQSAGFVSLVSLGQIGVIDKVHTRLSSSGQDVTTTLLAHAIDHCQRAQFETVITEIADGQASTGLFERIGFRPVISFDRYIRDD